MLKTKVRNLCARVSKLKYCSLRQEKCCIFVQGEQL